MKKFNNQSLLIAIIVLLASNIALLSYSTLFNNKPQENTPERKHFTGKKPHLEHMLLKELNLNEKQQSDIKERRIVFRKEKREIYKQMHHIRVQINKEITSIQPDTIRIDSLIHEFAQKHIAFDKHNINSLFEIKQHLTPEQSTKFDSIINKSGTFNRPFKHKRKPDSNRKTIK